MTIPVGNANTISKEYRFAVVMYGGVSLAIYMNGIAQELLNLVRSTAVQDRDDDSSPMLTDLRGTEAVYRELALLLSQENDSEVHVQFVIDIISGTSAGGINGIFLAKALAGRKDMQSLKRTWIDEGDFQKLMNDQSYCDSSINLPQQVPPRSLLSGESMYLKLFEAFAEMDDKPEQSYVDELNLWVTTTDLYGTVLPLRLADRVVFERRYKQTFYLRYSADANDFKRENTPFLAFAARCTSSFPVAFEPMQLSSIQKILPYSKTFREGKYDSNPEQWKCFFGPEDPRVNHSERFLADGGYLDNHPFDHAIEGLQRQSSRVLSERKLLYIEPSPEHPERENAERDRNTKLIQPDAIENAWDALAGIPGKQPIRDNLVLIQQRNRLIGKISSVIGAISSAIENSSDTRKLQVTPEANSGEQPADANKDSWKDRLQQVGFRAYAALNVYAVTDDLAMRIANLSGIDATSDYVFAIRCLVKAWRKQKYLKDEAQFLLDFDISYRVRRYRFVKSQMELLSRLDEEAKGRLRGIGVGVPDGETNVRVFRDELTKMRGAFDYSLRKLRAASEFKLQKDEIQCKAKALNIKEKDFQEILGVEKQVDATDEEGKERTATGERAAWAPLKVISESDYDSRAEQILAQGDRGAKLEVLRMAIADVYKSAAKEARENVERKLQPSAGDGAIRRDVLRLARLYFYGFQEFDAAIFPITYGTDVGELDLVDVIRISPEDAVAIVDEAKTGHHKLAGTAYGAFGAFLEKVWRTNDILWGRLDGAERIIRALAPTSLHCDDLIRRAHNAIIEEELKPEHRKEICQMLVDALLQTPEGETAERQQEKMLAAVKQCAGSVAGSTEINPKLVAVLQTALTADQVRCCLANFEISREPNREQALENIVRSSRIVGRMLNSMSRKRQALKKPGTLLLQAGTVAWGMLEVSIPRSIWSAFFDYWFSLLMLFSIVMIVGGTFLSPPVQELGFRLVALTLGTRLAVETLRRFISGKARWWRVLESVFLVAVAVLLALGLVELSHITQRLDGPFQTARVWIDHLLHGTARR